MSKRQLRPRPTKVNPDYGLIHKQKKVPRKQKKGADRRFLVSVTTLAPIHFEPDHRWSSHCNLTTGLVTVASTATLDRAFFTKYAEKKLDVDPSRMISMAILEVKDEPDNDTFVDKMVVFPRDADKREPLMSFHPL